LTKTLTTRLWTVLTFASHTPEIIGAEIVWVGGLRVALAAGRKRSLTLAVLTCLTSRTKVIRIVRQGVAVTAPGQTLALDTGVASAAAGVSIISLGVTVAARREGRLTRAVLAHISTGAETVWILSIGVTVTSQGQTLALDTGRTSRTRGVWLISSRITVASWRKHGSTAS